jgi:hypothetical protein
MLYSLACWILQRSVADVSPLLAEWRKQFPETTTSCRSTQDIHNLEADADIQWH